ncbi:hypothetical protein SISSUDRAFT_988335 [Sistotremastrum suecicum HHB10207 ss-3]|uniref:37S ribosomal protein mrp10, mitochondrial n=1 Tax=Sistotremastrum suecicum HHB10207 ss-3 TaxID=1314776 RepID=A0A166C1B4_9AGAM|nr:hypothetical protein SISSUDRAFT_988335 [Sistotremastrum suecicum HHB10207 ss-3]
MHIKKLKVRPRKDKPFTPCVEELALMLGCWASSRDINSIGLCAEHAENLHKCMRTAPVKTRSHRPTINYHLARLGKNLK